MIQTKVAQSDTEKKLVSTYKAAKEELGMSRGHIHYYMKLLGIKPQKFLGDVRTYITREEFERIKALREEAAKRRQA